MSEMRAQLVETAAALATGLTSLDAWREAGFDRLLTPEAEGGFGGDWGDAVAILWQAAYHDPQLPLSQITAPVSSGETIHDGALMAAASICGALQRVLEMSIDYANTRVQFGKPIGKQQSVQHMLAQLAEETALASVATLAAADARRERGGQFETGAAKLCANRAAAACVAIGHQIHGAIGFTQDFALQNYTRALSGWRSEGGSSAFWQARTAQFALAQAGSELWQAITDRDASSSSAD